MNRRELIQRVVLGGTVLVIVPSVFQSCTKTPVVPDPGTGNKPGTKIDLDLTLAANLALNTTGGSKIVQGIIVVNTGGGNFIALSSICTHQGCTVAYNSTASNFQCPCHGSAYSTSGSVINGPATVGLQSFPATKTGDILSISL